MIAILDYGVGNLFSLKSSFSAIGEDVTVTADPDIIRLADRLILPGVGAFSDASRKLRASGLDSVLKEQATAGKPLLGICLGMQLLFEKSFEYGEHEGLGLLRGVIRPIGDVTPPGYKIPHMGWNSLTFSKERHALFGNLEEGAFVYFVHSYYADAPSDKIIATAEYGAPITAAVADGNVMGCQFHPEKSGDTGLEILRAFCKL